MQNLLLCQSARVRSCDSFANLYYLTGDYEGSDGEGEFYDENEYDNSEPAGYTSENPKHWERIIQPDVSNIKEEKVCFNHLFIGDVIT